MYGRSTSDHRNPIGDEPPIEYNQGEVGLFYLYFGWILAFAAELDRVSHLLLPEYERLCEYLRKKRLLDVAEGITQPASLLNCFHCILEKRRQQLVSILLVFLLFVWLTAVLRTFFVYLLLLYGFANKC